MSVWCSHENLDIGMFIFSINAVIYTCIYIFGHTCSSIYIIFSTYPSSTLSLVSGINFLLNSRLLSVNHALNTPILTPVLWVALLPSVPSTRHSSSIHSFIPGLKPYFPQILLSHRNLPYLLISVSYFLVFLFSIFFYFGSVFPCGRLSAR